MGCDGIYTIGWDDVEWKGSGLDWIGLDWMRWKGKDWMGGIGCDVM